MPDHRDLTQISQDFATARRLYAALHAGDHESVANVLRTVAESARGASVLLAATQLGLEFAHSCESAGLLRDDEGELTLQGFLDSSALNQINDTEA
ncbi:hypothetical protein BST27_17065 [Mycobacterium intermedium]|uniref:Uncharacterized protein n=1 Tax=Mycobacterium intermedium TaxID=28445 RepID=A0A1E3SDT4_MYCIE|nr:hypothetical protein [Mycobacterium intermedium]MCV6966034.1 hypothetical protein [Mycobacterium intermedium]ODR00297.1 hypothetical protein BHQ20_13110 [Mycobacterium intermedium]ORB01894.1 hypothetical protein BST27_17065 [Mycobacterium intermedium]